MMPSEYINRTLYGDCRDSLVELKEAGVVANLIVTSPPYWSLRSYLRDDDPMKSYELGSEATPEEYVDNMVGVFRLARDILAPDGVMFLNIGDTYAGSGGPGNQRDNKPAKGQFQKFKNANRSVQGIKPKDLVGIPWMLAFALRDDGWWLRSDIIWSKPNPMPESVTDRPTQSHEHIFMLTKNQQYFFDSEAVREKAITEGDCRYKRTDNSKNRGNPRDDSGSRFRTGNPTAGRNIRNVWEVQTQPFHGSHFATFPERLPEIAILAGTSEYGHCPNCGRGWRRIMEKGEPLEEQRLQCGADSTGGYHGTATKNYGSHKAQDPSAVKARILDGMRERITTGWEPTCSCDDNVPVPGMVLDPFGGSGTTGQVAERLGRRWILCELNEDYRSLIERRTAQMGLFSV